MKIMRTGFLLMVGVMVAILCCALVQVAIVLLIDLVGG